MIDGVRVGDEVGDEVGVPEVTLDELVRHALAVGGIAVDVERVLLDTEVVKRVHRVEDRHVVAVFEERFGQMSPDEPGAPSDEYVHA